jgi:hypothetical protein
LIFIAKIIPNTAHYHVRIISISYKYLFKLWGLLCNKFSDKPFLDSRNQESMGKGKEAQK